MSHGNASHNRPRGVRAHRPVRLAKAGRITSLTAIILMAAVLSPAWAAPPVALPAPMPPGVAPVWTPVPPAPGVLYAPNIPGNVFRVHKKYYYYYGGYWYQSKHPMGPWHPVRKVPKALLRVPRPYFK